jgi:hypothetical protein
MADSAAFVHLAAPPDAPAFDHPADFYRVRDFGQKWEATAQLLRQHGRLLLLTLLRYTAPWLLAGALVQALIIKYPFSIPYSGGLVYLGVFLERVGEIVGTGIIYGFFRLRMNMHQSPGYRLTPTDIWEATEGIGLYFGKYLAVVLLCVVGLLLMIAPSVYVYVAFALVPGVVFMEHDGLTRTFELIKGSWWATAALVATVLGLSLGLNVVPSWLSGRFFAVNWGNDSAWIWLLLLAQQLYGAAALLGLLLVREVLMGFHYFGLIEARESPGLEWRASRLGQEPAPAPAAPDTLYAPDDQAHL